jgi:hypothetical protein
MKVSSYDAHSYEDQSIYSGYYRNTGWMPNQLNLTELTTSPPVGIGTEVLTVTNQVPATGTTAVPDEQAHTPPRSLTWDETKLKFTLAGRVVAEFWWKDIKSWSTKAPVVA